jgi:heptaprenyl diphosphate synthase
VAFQLSDDILDIASESAESGKTPGTDLREGVPTLPVLLLRQAAAGGDASAAAVLELVDADLSTDEALARAVEALRGHPATEQAWQVARQWAEEAKAVLAPLPESTVKLALAAFAEAVVDRDV